MIGRAIVGEWPENQILISDWKEKGTSFMPNKFSQAVDMEGELNGL